MDRIGTGRENIFRLFMCVNNRIRELSAKAPPGDRIGIGTLLKYFRYAKSTPSYYSVGKFFKIGLYISVALVVPL